MIKIYSRVKVKRMEEIDKQKIPSAILYTDYDRFIYPNGIPAPDKVYLVNDVIFSKEWNVLAIKINGHRIVEKGTNVEGYWNAECFDEIQ